MASRVVVTGAGGRIGGGIAARLAASGRLLAGIDRVGGEHVSHVLDLATPSMALETDLLQVFDGADAVVHVAAHPGPSATPPPTVDAAAAASAASAIGLEDVDPVSLATENFSSTMRVFDAAARVKAARVVFSSTAFTAGWCHKSTQRLPAALPLTEEDAAPHESYGLSKICCEHAAAMYAAATEQQTTFVSLRFTNIVKREKLQDLPWSYSDWTGSGTMADGNPVPPPLPLAFWAWTHEDDVLDAHLAALEDPDEWSDAMADGAPYAPPCLVTPAPACTAAVCAVAPELRLSPCCLPPEPRATALISAFVLCCVPVCRLLCRRGAGGARRRIVPARGAIDALRRVDG
jgi:nucleoside-diphosphate-sugar epimerase